MVGVLPGPGPFPLSAFLPGGGPPPHPFLLLRLPGPLLLSQLSPSHLHKAPQAQCTLSPLMVTQPAWEAGHWGLGAP